MIIFTLSAASAARLRLGSKRGTTGARQPGSYWFRTSIDIDVYKKTGAPLREREFSQLINMVPSHLWRLTPDGGPTFFNKRMVNLLGPDVPDTDNPGMSRPEAAVETAIHRWMSSRGIG